MHASNVTLSLAASAAAPVLAALAAPIHVRNASDASPTANLLLFCSLSNSCTQYSDAGISVYMVRGVTDVQTETVARDGMGDDFIAALLKSRVSEIISEDSHSPVSLASRAYHDLD